jgi:hypothetical protein
MQILIFIDDLCLMELDFYKGKEGRNEENKD